LKLFIMPKGDETVGSSRYRAYGMGIQLKKKGWDVFFASPALLPVRDLKSRLHYLLKNLMILLSAYPDVILVQRADRRYEQLWFLKFCRLIGAKIVYDVDDPITISSPVTSWVLKNASAIFSGSHYLFDILSKFNKNVYLVPTTIDFSIYNFKKSRKFNGEDEDIVIGWIGTGPAYINGLKRIADMFRKLPGGVKKRIKFRCVGTLGDSRIESFLNENYIGVRSELIRNINWKDEYTVVEELAKFDVGLSPWKGNKAGVAFKTIQYMALGIIPIAEAAGENIYHIDNGKNGFLVKVNDTNEWTHCIEHVVTMHSEKWKMISENARKSAKNHYSLDRHAERVNEFLRKLL